MSHFLESNSFEVRGVGCTTFLRATAICSDWRKNVRCVFANGQTNSDPTEMNSARNRSVTGCGDLVHGRSQNFQLPITFSYFNTVRKHNSIVLWRR